ncbi:MAG TPA: peptidoglycan-associated lipoprotein Pal [Candidatus Polarisedimenticolaceae bacterium]|nr:peptidoglycan-associated lipoprotein Pal [Candidatus Polarisedimenticolaceae bacterium]
MRTLSRFPLVLAVVALMALGATACSTKAKPSATPDTTTAAPPPVETKPAPEPAPVAAEPFPTQQVDKAPVETSIDDLNRQGVLKTIYFAYNSNDLDDASKATLQANASWLNAHPTHTVEIGGHCDERGSIGYNVALGDRRANSVKEYLTTLGVNGGKLSAISYGEERPADPGHTEAAWSKNRRAEFTIKS